MEVAVPIDPLQIRRGAAGAAAPPAGLAPAESAAFHVSPQRALPRWLRPESRPTTPGGSTRSPPTPNGDPPFPVLFDPDAKVVLDKYGTQLSPETWILDPDEILRARFDGARDGSSSLALEVGEMVSCGGGCPADIFRGTQRAGSPAVCTDDS